MAKKIEICVDSDSSTLSVGAGRLFLGTVQGVEFEGWKPEAGNEAVLTLFAHDGVTPLAQSRVEDGRVVLDLTGENLRKVFGCAPARHQFALYLNQRGPGGNFLPEIEAVGTVYVDWSPEVFDAATGDVATLKGPPGSPGADGRSAYELAVVNGYSGSLGDWLGEMQYKRALHGRTFDFSGATSRKLADAMKAVFEALGGEVE